MGLGGGDGGYVALELLNMFLKQELPSAGCVFWASRSRSRQRGDLPRGATLARLPPLPDGRSPELATLIDGCPPPIRRGAATARDVVFRARDARGSGEELRPSSSRARAVCVAVYCTIIKRLKSSSRCVCVAESKLARRRQSKQITSSRCEDITMPMSIRTSPPLKTLFFRLSLSYSGKSTLHSFVSISRFHSSS